MLDRKAHAAGADARGATQLSALALALAAHDPARTLERGYALVTDDAGEPVTSAAAARRAGDVRLRFGDAAVDATISERAMTEPEPIPLTAEPLTYEAATARLEAIIKRLDSGEAGLRETLELCREGRTLVELCAAELEAVGQGLEELQLGELVARLEAGAGARAAERRGAGARGETRGAVASSERVGTPDAARLARNPSI